MATMRTAGSCGCVQLAIGRTTYVSLRHGDELPMIASHALQRAVDAGAADLEPPRNQGSFRAAGSFPGPCHNLDMLTV
jgi:hypothetical protein